MKLAIALGVLALVALAVHHWIAGVGATMTPDEFVATLTDDDLVLDVRTGREYAVGHLAGARHADLLGDFRSAVADVPRDTRVFTYCASGARSGRATQVLRDMGFTDVSNVGSIGALRRAGAPMADRSSRGS